MAKTKIEWTDETWNPTSGCSKVSSGCKNCYAESLARRFNKDFKPWAASNAAHNVRLHPERLEQPLHWKKPQRVFVNSVSDLFHEQVPDEFIDQVFAEMAIAAQHTFQVLTKRANRMSDYIAGLGKSFARLKATCPVGWSMEYEEIPLVRWPLLNVWLGVSAEDQPTFYERVTHLVHTPAAVRFVSLEPMLGPVDPTRATILKEDGMAPGVYLNTLTGYVAGPDDMTDMKLDWVIVGSESGPGRRQTDMEWVRAIRDQCVTANVPLFVKQLHIDGKKVSMPELDGRIWDEMPT